jgi:hypothetical protein
MARYKAELPNDLIKEFEELGKNAEKMIGEMTKAGAEVAYELVKTNMKKSFKTTKSLEKGLKMTKVYKAPSKDSIGVYIGFYGYDPDSKPTKRHPYGTPIDLIAKAREYGTSRGEDKKPFFRKSFKRKDIEQAMLSVQKKYIKGD